MPVHNGFNSPAGVIQPPNVYNVLVPGRFNILWASVGATITFEGKLRKNLEIYNSLNRDNKGGIKSIQPDTLWPDAWKVAINIKSLIPNNLNTQLAYYLGGWEDSTNVILSSNAGDFLARNNQQDAAVYNMNAARHNVDEIKAEYTQTDLSKHASFAKTNIEYKKARERMERLQNGANDQNTEDVFNAQQDIVNREVLANSDIIQRINDRLGTNYNIIQPVNTKTLGIKSDVEIKAQVEKNTQIEEERTKKNAETTVDIGEKSYDKNAAVFNNRQIGQGLSVGVAQQRQNYYRELQKRGETVEGAVLTVNTIQVESGNIYKTTQFDMNYRTAG